MTTRPLLLPLVCALIGAGLGCHHPPVPAETALRAKLGVPSDATTVVVFSQTAHLDVDWQQTFDAYYSNFVDQIFTEAEGILTTQPRAYYSVAEMAYLGNYLQVHPDQLAQFRALAKSGALRIVGGGVTSPDTLLPETELLVRDYLYGAQLSEDTLGADPRAAWLPDSFGHAATVPDLLSAAGFLSVALARVDGAPTLFENIRNPQWPLAPDSTAELLKNLGSADFLWKGPGGGQVLAHLLMPNLYCTGDNIDYNEPLQLPGGHVGPYMGADSSYTDGMIESYATAIRPYAKTPYLFVTVGCDFQHPKTGLIGYLDGFNQRHFHVKGDAYAGTYAVAATFEDYSTLVLAHQSELPVIDSADISPYFMGFYGTRADVKQATRAALRPFAVAETFASALGSEGAAALAPGASALRMLARADHHDFITGTSTDAVAENEQLPLLASATATGASVLGSVAQALANHIAPVSGSLGRLLALNDSGVQQSVVIAADVPFTLPAGGLHAVAGSNQLPVEVGTDAVTGDPQVQLVLDGMQPFSWQAIDLLPGGVTDPPRVTVQLLDDSGNPATGSAVTVVVLSNEHITATWTRSPAFALTSLKLDGVEAIAGPSFLIADASDDGGLWRLGNEMSAPCGLTPMAPSPVEQAGETVQVVASTPMSATVVFQDAAYSSNGLSTGTPTAFQLPAATREVRLDAGASWLDLAVTTGAAQATTRTVSFAFAIPAGAPLRSSEAAGYLDRVPQHVYTPTYWPAVEWASAGPWTLAVRQSTGVLFSATGEMELMAVRDARSEQCDVLGGTGSDTGIHRIEWRIGTASTPAASAQAAQAFNRPVWMGPVTASESVESPAMPNSDVVLSVQGEGIVTALKPADRGTGLVLRGVLLPGPLQVSASQWVPAGSAVRDDITERDLEKLGKISGAIALDSSHFGALPTVRLTP